MTAHVQEHEDTCQGKKSALDIAQAASTEQETGAAELKASEETKEKVRNKEESQEQPGTKSGEGNDYINEGQSVDNGFSTEAQNEGSPGQATQVSWTHQTDTSLLLSISKMRIMLTACS